MTVKKSTPADFNRHPVPIINLMTMLLPLALLLPTLAFSYTNNQTEPSPLKFTASDYLEVQQKAKAEGKLFFLHFTAKHVESCKWMAKHTFNNEKLSDYLSQSYLATEIDVEQPEGAKLQYQFEVNFLPTTLVFSSEGELIGALEGKQNAEDMMGRLRGYDTPEYRVIPAETKGGPVQPAAYRAVKYKVSRPRLVPDILPLPDHNQYQLPVAETTNNNASVISEQYPSIYAQPQAALKPERPTSFYAVQVGVFANHQNAYREKTNLERYGNDGHVLPFKGTDGHTKYRLCVGTFPNRAGAELLQSKLTPRYADSFVRQVKD